MGSILIWSLLISMIAHSFFETIMIGQFDAGFVHFFKEGYWLIEMVLLTIFGCSLRHNKLLAVVSFVFSQLLIAVTALTIISGREIIQYKVNKVDSFGHPSSR